jgi:glycosyltransferase involved in cell wall biosynthesis
MRLVLWGDGESPHLLKWARALAPQLDLWAASSRGFLPGFDALLPPERRLALGTQPNAGGGNIALLRKLPQFAGWLRRVRPHWVHAHYLTSHGTLAWLARTMFGTPGQLVGSAWGSDVLVTPQRSALQRALLGRVLRDCALTTSDSQHMAQRMRELGAGEVMCFPFGLVGLPLLPDRKDDALFFANRGLEPIYAPQRVIDTFAAVATQWPQARLVLANDGSLMGALQAQVQHLGLLGQVRFVGRLDAATQAEHYAKARWYLSLPRSDSVSVSVLEAMAHGCVPLLSDLPANHELVRSGDNGLILADGAMPSPPALQALLVRGDDIARANHDWVRQHAMFGPGVQAFLARLRELQPA